MTDDKKKLVVLIALSAIILSAFFMRFWQLDAVPPGLNVDEAANGNDAIQAMLTGDYKVFYPDNYGREGLHITLTSFVFKILGVGVWQLRFIGALAGVLTVLGIYFLAREFFVRSVALLASFFVAFSFWHVLLCRIGYRASLALLLMVWSFYFLWRGLRERSMKLSGLYFVLFSILFGLGLYTYIAFRAAILLLLLVFIIKIIPSLKERKKGWKEFFIQQGVWRWILSFGLISSLGLPLVVVSLHMHELFYKRTLAISVLEAERPLIELFLNIIRTIVSFNVVGEMQWLHNIKGSPILLAPVGILFILGFLVLYFRKYKEVRELELNADWRWFFIAWLLIMVLPSLLTREAVPHSLRSIGAVPAVYILVGIGGMGLYILMKKFAEIYFRSLQRLFLFAAIIFCASIAATQFDKYFHLWVERPEVEYSFTNYQYRLAQRLSDLPEDTKKYIVVDIDGGVEVDGFVVQVQPLIFFTYNMQNLELLTTEQAATRVFTEEDEVVYMSELEPKIEDLLQ